MFRHSKDCLVCLLLLLFVVSCTTAYPSIPDIKPADNNDNSYPKPIPYFTYAKPSTLHYVKRTLGRLDIGPVFGVGVDSTFFRVAQDDGGSSNEACNGPSRQFVNATVVREADVLLGGVPSRYSWLIDACGIWC
jgi:hypothetical protein